MANDSDNTVRAPTWMAMARASAAAGTLLVSYGAWLAWRPAGFMVAGVLLLVVGIGAMRA